MQVGRLSGIEKFEDRSLIWYDMSFKTTWRDVQLKQEECEWILELCTDGNQ